MFFEVEMVGWDAQEISNRQGGDLNSLRDLIEEGKVKPVVDSVFAFEDTLKAYERILGKCAKGKVVVKVDL